MSEHVISDDIINNMGDISAMLAERSYTIATVPMQGETVVRNEFGADAPAVSADGMFAVPGGVPQPAPGVVPGQGVPAQPAEVYPLRAAPVPVEPYRLPGQPEPEPAISVERYNAAMAYAARMQEVAQEAAQARMEAEDEAFLRSIEHLDEVAQDREILIRYNQQLQAANEGMAQQYQQSAAQAEAKEQFEAKLEVAQIYALENNLPWWNPGIQRMLMSAPDDATMQRIVADLKTLTPAQQQTVTPTPAQVAGQVVAAPARGRGGRAAPAVKERSGDIMGLLTSRPYQIGQ